MKEHLTDFPYMLMKTLTYPWLKILRPLNIRVSSSLSNTKTSIESLSVLGRICTVQIQLKASILLNISRTILDSQNSRDMSLLSESKNQFSFVIIFFVFVDTFKNKLGLSWAKLSQSCIVFKLNGFCCDLNLISLKSDNTSIGSMELNH